MATDDAGIAAGWDRSAAAYDDVLDANRRGAERLVAALPDAPYREVVDVGCGTGFASWAMARRAGARRLTGVDVAPAMVERYLERLGGLPGVAVDAVVAPADAMPLPAASADAVVSAMALHWMPDRAGAVAAMARLLRPGGTLGVLCSGAGADGEYRDLIAGLDPPVPAELVDAYARMQAAEGELEDHARAAGLEPVDAWTERRRRRMPPERFLARKRATESALIAHLPEEEREAMWRRIAAAVHAAAEPGGFAFTFVKAYVVARAPGPAPPGA
ncbi:class I SAM-dependent methyltransferase [Miltoncostaea marina]|uniref:class I SAM-dependent methyltransferase n=1 Tax=Miltoncostaea marina TaxID=2843215 RepID=UPI001C3D9804|nr:methyltransferase domain-containing protein [Miltoncostaea marina]